MREGVIGLPRAMPLGPKEILKRAYKIPKDAYIIPPLVILSPRSGLHIESGRILEDHPMRIPLLTPALLSSLLVAIPGTPARANLFSDAFDVVVVAERGKSVPDELAKPTTYVAFDGGYIEAGDPIAGDDPPPAGQVRQSLVAAFAARGFQESQTVPKLLVVYHWGVLRVDHQQIRIPFQVRDNLSARISLVSTAKLDAEVENHIRDREKARGENLSYASPRFLVPPLDSVVARARLPRIFVVVSAYDFQAFFQKHEARLIWQTKLSAQETSGKMEQVIPPMLTAGAAYLGSDSQDIAVEKSLLATKPAPAPAFAPPTPESYHLDSRVLGELIRRERFAVSGQAEGN